MYTTVACSVTFRNYGKIDIPSGLRVVEVPEERDSYWLDEFPADLFPLNSMELHDAIHYGVWLDASNVQLSNA